MKQSNSLSLPYWLIVAATVSRFLPHPPNFTAVGGTALYSGAHLKGIYRYFVPATAMLVSDAILGWHRTMPFVYAAFAFNVWLGSRIASKPKAIRVGSAALAGSVTFYLVTNFGVWWSGMWYPHTAAGLATCYVRALPFAKWTILGDLTFTAVLFGATAAINYYYKNKNTIPKEVKYVR